MAFIFALSVLYTALNYICGFAGTPGYHLMDVEGPFLHNWQKIPKGYNYIEEPKRKSDDAAGMEGECRKHAPGLIGTNREIDQCGGLLIGAKKYLKKFK